MRARRRITDLLHALLFAALTMPLQACLLVISSGPTSLDDANIVFVVFDQAGTPVSGATLIVAASASDWRQTGHTGSDGVYECRVSSGVSRVSVRLEPPRGYAPSTGPSPMVVDVEAGGSQRVELRVRRST